MGSFCKVGGKGLKRGLVGPFMGYFANGGITPFSAIHGIVFANGAGMGYICPVAHAIGAGGVWVAQLLLPLHSPQLLGMAFAFGLPLAVAVTVTPTIFTVLRLPGGWGDGAGCRACRSASISAGERANSFAHAAIY